MFTLENLPVFIGAFSGAIISAAVPKALTPRQRLLYVFAGTTGGFFLTPLLSHYFRLPMELYTGVSFGIGGLLMWAVAKAKHLKSIGLAGVTFNIKHNEKTH